MPGVMMDQDDQQHRAAEWHAMAQAEGEHQRERRGDERRDEAH
jgi:hypothetical protein